MPVVCVIPARAGSTRLREKPLQILGDEPLIRLVARRAIFLGGVDQVVVATDDARVIEAVADLQDVTGMMTSPDHASGTERVGEIAGASAFTGATFINLQGDEPFVPTEAVDGVLELMRSGQRLATAACPLRPGDLENESVVKVFMSGGMATAFRRQLPRDANDRWTPGTIGGWARHLGVYAYTRDALLDWVNLPPVAAETDERLEQLRPMAHGKRMAVATINQPAPPGIDTPEDLAAAQRYLETLQEKVVA